MATIGDRADRVFADLMRGTRDARVRARMNRTVLGVATLLALSGTASAGTYLGLGIGTAPALSDETNALDSGSRSAKALVGYSFGQTVGNFGGRIAIEGSFGGNAVSTSDRGVSVPYGNLYHLSGAGKFSLPLGSNFEAFGRVGLQRAWLRDNDTNSNFRSGVGNGFLIGAGFEYRLKLGRGGGSIFVDYQVNRFNIADDVDSRQDNKLTTRVWMLGLTVGI